MRRIVIAIAAAFLVSGVSSYFIFQPNIELWMAMRPSSARQPIHPSIVMLGDSHTEFVNWRLLMHCASIANFGIGGNTTSQILARLPTVLEEHPRMVVLMAGTNDALQNMPGVKTAGNLREIEREIEDEGINFVSVTPPPLPIRKDAITASMTVASLKVAFTTDDLLGDKIHMRRSGYAKWRDAVAPLIKRYCDNPNEK